jgi:hypothetical protein
MAFEETKKFGTKSKTKIVEIKKLVSQVQSEIKRQTTIDSKSTRKITQPQAKTLSSKEKARLSGTSTLKTRESGIPTFKIIKRSDNCTIYLDQLFAVVELSLNYRKELKVIFNQIKAISDQIKNQGMTESEKARLNEELSETLRRLKEIKRAIDSLTENLDQIRAAYENCSAKKPLSTEEIGAFENKMNKIKESYK